MAATQKRRYPKKSSRIELWISDPDKFRRRVRGTVVENDYRMKRTIIHLDEQPEGVSMIVDPLNISYTPVETVHGINAIWQNCVDEEMAPYDERKASFGWFTSLEGARETAELYTDFHLMCDRPGKLGWYWSADGTYIVAHFSRGRILHVSIETIERAVHPDVQYTIPWREQKPDLYAGHPYMKIDPPEPVPFPVDPSLD